MRRPSSLPTKLALALFVLLDALLISAVLHFWFPQLLNFPFTEIFRTYKDCDIPITYSIGSFDTRFGISRADFLKSIDKAEGIWAASVPVDKAGKRAELFEYQETGGVLKINLVYDTRQEITEKLKTLGITVNDDRASYNALKAKFDALKAELDTKEKNYTPQVDAYNAKSDRLEKDIAAANARGGASGEAYAELQRRRDALDAEFARLKRVEDDVNATIANLNAVVPALNQQANLLSLAAENYNYTGSQRGETFEQGVYQSSATGTEIDIYQFENSAKLTRVLAHELGHALGLEHVTDTAAIMYYLNRSTNDELSKTDVEQLKRVCRL